MADDKIEISLNVFLDTGLQKFFVPLRKPSNFTIPSKGVELPKSLDEAVENVKKYEEEDCIPEETKELLDKEVFGPEAKHHGFSAIKDFLCWRFGKKTWHLKNGNEVSLNGIWFLVETNTSNHDGNKDSKRSLDRGYFYRKDGLSEKEKEEAIEAEKRGEKSDCGKSVYIPYKNEDEMELIFDYAGAVLDFGKLRFMLKITKPNIIDFIDVDVILDLGNTRTACLLFDNSEKEQFEPSDFKRLFKILRLKPDPDSGEYDSLGDVDSGIAPSWIVLHQLPHQSYLGHNDRKTPRLLQVERKIEVTSYEEGWIFKKTQYAVAGEVIKRIPQMYTQMSPVLVGDQAERVFNLPYARNLVAVGANLQQSSPKRYYWDDTKRKELWNMMLNEWEERYNEEPEKATSLPTLQGEMLRFMRQDGQIIDHSVELSPEETPDPYPAEPNYPKQSSLTWFLLHILERAYAQTNSTFVRGANFIPHRLRRVLITYPSGWAADEVERYRLRCQEALDIFSQANVYHGVKSDLSLEMIKQEFTPDEAVAGQLPFVFSEINRYKSRNVEDWISLMGKKRSNGESVRIMNFDIGGGTTDISVIEYQDASAGDCVGVQMNNLRTTLLFKDGQAIAGDDLLKRIIAKHILGGLVQKKRGGERVANEVLRLFSQTLTEKDDEAIRSRIVRTCLVPLATKCLAEVGQETVSFSAKSAGVNMNNWEEFLLFLGLVKVENGVKKANNDALPFELEVFSFESSELNALMEELFSPIFRRCAMYAAAYDVDMVVFSGKPSELPYIRQMARHYIPIGNGRLIFARDFKPGDWYPFVDNNGYIQDAKTVTVVGSALYYALSKGFISNWRITSGEYRVEPNEWGEIGEMKWRKKLAFMSKGDNERQVKMLPNQIIARRQNRGSDPEPVYKFTKHGGDKDNELVSVTLRRKNTNGGDGLEIVAVNGDPNVEGYELKLWPCETAGGYTFWQEEGIFENIGE